MVMKPLRVVMRVHFEKWWLRQYLSPSKCLTVSAIDYYHIGQWQNDPHYAEMIPQGTLNCRVDDEAPQADLVYMMEGTDANGNIEKANQGLERCLCLWAFSVLPRDPSLILSSCIRCSQPPAVPAPRDQRTLAPVGTCFQKTTHIHII